MSRLFNKGQSRQVNYSESPPILVTGQTWHYSEIGIVVRFKVCGKFWNTNQDFEPHLQFKLRTIKPYVQINWFL